MKLNRRRFLMASSGLLLTHTNLQAASSPLIAPNAGKRILIAGAGLAGLATALELVQLGFAVTIIEGRDRIGGRVFTLREGFAADQHVEIGGELIGNGYKRLLAYATKLGVAYEDVPPDVSTGGSVASQLGGISGSAIMKGKFYAAGEKLDPHPYDLKGDEATALPPNLLSRYTRQIAQEVAINPALMASFDQLSLADVLRQRGLSAGAIRLMNIALNYNDIETVSAASLIFDSQRRMGAGNKACRLIGGNDSLPKALAAAAQKAGVTIILNATIKDIQYATDMVSVKFEVLRAEKLVCTIPFAALREVAFSPPLPLAKAKAIKELAYTNITKVYLQGNRAQWNKRQIGSSVWTDTPIERIFSVAGNNADSDENAVGIFAAWMDGQGASAPDAMMDDARQVWALREFEKALPFMVGSIKTGQTKSWANDKFARGAYAHYTRGQVTTLQPAIKMPVGAIHFAGEHTAEKSPGMEGALESAERVVAEITANFS
jgi:monoamine oxidase